MLKFDEGPCFNWPPSELMVLSDKEVEGYAKLLSDTREEYARQLKNAADRAKSGDNY